MCIYVSVCLFASPCLVVQLCFCVLCSCSVWLVVVSAISLVILLLIVIFVIAKAVQRQRDVNHYRQLETDSELTMYARWYIWTYLLSSPLLPLCMWCLEISLLLLICFDIICRLLFLDQELLIWLFLLVLPTWKSLRFRHFGLGWNLAELFLK